MSRLERSDDDIQDSIKLGLRSNVSVRMQEQRGYLESARIAQILTPVVRNLLDDAYQQGYAAAVGDYSDGWGNPA